MDKVYKLYSNADSHHSYYVNGVRHDFQDDWGLVEHLLGGDAHTIHIDPPDYFSMTSEELDVVESLYSVDHIDDLFDMFDEHEFLKGEVY